LKSNISIVCVINRKGKVIAEHVAKKFDFYSVDVADLLNFNMVDEQKVIETCGTEYLNKLQNDAINQVANYYDTVISVHPKFLTEKKNAAILKKKSIVIFLKISKGILEEYAKTLKRGVEKSGLLTDVIVCDERNKTISESADLVLDFNKLNEVRIIKKIIKELEKFAMKI